MVLGFRVLERDTFNPKFLEVEDQPFPNPNLSSKIEAVTLGFTIQPQEVRLPGLHLFTCWADIFLKLLGLRVLPITNPKP